MSKDNVVFLNTADDILGLDDLEIVEFEVKGAGKAWDGKRVYLRTLTGAERDRIESMMAGARRGDGSFRFPENYKAKIAAQGLVNEKGDRLFTDRQADALGRKHSAAVHQIAEEVLRISGMATGALDEAKNDSESDQNGDSTTD